MQYGCVSVIKTFGKNLNPTKWLEDTWPNIRLDQDTMDSQKSECQHLILVFEKHWLFFFNESHQQPNFSVIFTWLFTIPGDFKCSLCMYLCQYHIWGSALLLAKFSLGWNCCWPLCDSPGPEEAAGNGCFPSDGLDHLLLHCFASYLWLASASELT